MYYAKAEASGFQRMVQTSRANDNKAEGLCRIPFLNLLHVVVSRPAYLGVVDRCHHAKNGPPASALCATLTASIRAHCYNF